MSHSSVREDVAQRKSMNECSHSVSTHSKNTSYKMAARSPFIELGS